MWDDVIEFLNSLKEAEVTELDEETTDELAEMVEDVLNYG